MKRSRKTLGAFKKSAASTAINVAAITAAVTTAGFAIRSFTNAASRAQETMNLFNTVFAENSTATAKWANDFAKNIGRSKTEVKEWAATLQDTFVPLGFARDRAAELSKTLVELAVDVASFKNIASDREVIDSFTSAIVGNHRAVRAYGVVITNATIETASFKAGLGKTFAQLTELEKVQLRYNIIMDSTKDAQGDAAKTATNYANRVKKLKGQAEDLKELLGNELMPVMSRIVSFTSNKMIPIFKKLGRGFNVLIKFAQSNTVKYLAMSTAIVFTVSKIVVLIKWVKSLNLVWRAAVITRTLLSAAMGPKGWVAIAVGIGVATAAIVSMNNAMKDTATKMDGISTAAKKSLQAAATTIDELRDEVARKAAFLEKVQVKKKGITEAGRNKAVDIAQKSLNLSRMQLVNAIQQERVVRDIARAERDRLAQQKRNISGLDAITGFVTDLQQRVDEVGLSELEAQLQRLDKIRDGLEGEAWKEFNKGTKEAERLVAELIEKEKLFKDSQEEKEPLGQLASGRFQEIRSEFIDVAALNAGSSTTGVNKTNALMEKSISIQQQTLTEITGKDIL
jgi:hypothetical protein